MGTDTATATDTGRNAMAALSETGTFSPVRAPRNDVSPATAEKHVCVVGLGYIGLPTASLLGTRGYQVTGVDVSKDVVATINQGRIHIVEPDLDVMVKSAVHSGRLQATMRPVEADVFIIAVPTPLGRHQEPDISYILNTAEAIGKTLRSGQLIILESTTYPGTTRDDMMPAIFKAAGDRAKSLQLGRDIFGAFSPEREDPGRKSHSTSTIPKLVGGLDEVSTELAASVYRKGVKEVEMSWILETNEAMKGIIEILGGRQSKHYRVYEKALA